MKKQLLGDSDSGAVVGGFEGRTIGVVSYILKLGEHT